MQSSLNSYKLISLNNYSNFNKKKNKFFGQCADRYIKYIIPGIHQKQTNKQINNRGLFQQDLVDWLGKILKEVDLIAGQLKSDKKGEKFMRIKYRLKKVGSQRNEGRGRKNLQAKEEGLKIRERKIIERQKTQ
ncbi:hypothetical protein TTHERM_00823680 (macronuclear) [Tetrahymena thermophila SB210]|uniref:Uncharacterized protein n=1 Tax=Tetrahymena thermophila (strain SB210) TaxID=312017 RepID=I7M5Y4_TETTS|nr:hypothetical protein TTHERM_00823680 [Tetrahymena thermophila SB210]EAR83807.1 hypothetical protein TTHERM_00823680 [Tetrahymena thermophila SB210]|eukprot:XP_001031470.1 hypothetical protein TTHERM_00823680 [Tetrahymena thermophila SB210]